MTNNKIKTNSIGQLFLNPIELATTVEPFLVKKRRHKGWIKRVISLNKEETNEFSLVGEFVKEGVQWLSPGVYIDCSVKVGVIYARFMPWYFKNLIAHKINYV